ncbi:MAG: 50S ribosomal protein L5 [Candidatus Berkelbacteria bacterium]
METLKERFHKTIKQALKKSLNKKNISEVPEIEKVVISSGIGDWKDSKDTIEKISVEIAKLTGQKPKINMSKTSVSAFKLRENQPVGMTVTLRGDRKYDFIDRLTNVAIPRIRDFRGLSEKSFDEHGNYSLGIKDYSIFPEIKYEDIPVNFGLQVNIKIRSKSKEDATALLKELGFPFVKK